MITNTLPKVSRYGATVTIAEFSRSGRRREADGSAVAEATPRDDALSLAFMDAAEGELAMTTISLFVEQQPYPDWAPPRRIEVRRSEAPRPQPQPGISIGRRIATWIARARQRNALATLDDRMLRDIGITRYDAAHEYGKPFWR
jgi:uncharacterized protein YjiS (DUF1127 family)